jgi:dGTP triphosphohydrolase
MTNGRGSNLDSLTDKFSLIFEQSLRDLKEENYHAPIFKDHIEYIDDRGYSTYYKPLKSQKKLNILVRDYIAGMSDKYFNEIYDKYLLRI